MSALARIQRLVQLVILGFASEDLDRQVHALRQDLEALRQELRGELARLRGRLERSAPGRTEGRGRFWPEMTVAQALAVDPGVEDLLARHEVGGCGSCAVSEHETLAEVCGTYGLDLEALLAELEALGGTAGDPRPPFRILA